MIREFILCRSPGDLSSAAALPGKQLLCATAPGARGGPAGTWLFLVELSCQPMGLGLPGWVHSCAWGWNSWGGGDLLLERGFHPGSGTCPMEDAAGQLSPGTRYGLALFPGRAGRGRGHGQTNPEAHLTRGKCPLGRKKQLCGQKRKKRTRARQCKERSSWHCLCFHALAEEIFCWSRICASLMDTGAASRVWGAEICPCHSA